MADQTMFKKLWFIILVYLYSASPFIHSHSSRNIRTHRTLCIEHSKSCDEWSEKHKMQDYERKKYFVRIMFA